MVFATKRAPVTRILAILPREVFPSEWRKLGCLKFPLRAEKNETLLRWHQYEWVEVRGRKVQWTRFPSILEIRERLRNSWKDVTKALPVCSGSLATPAVFSRYKPRLIHWNLDSSLFPPRSTPSRESVFGHLHSRTSVAKSFHVRRHKDIIIWLLQLFSQSPSNCMTSQHSWQGKGMPRICRRDLHHRNSMSL